VSKLNPNHLTWAIALMLTLGVPGSIVAWNVTRHPTVIVNPTPAPVVVVDYKQAVKDATADLTDEQRGYAMTQFAAIAAICKMPKQPADDGELQELLTATRKAYYGSAYPFKDELSKFTEVTKVESLKRGLVADGDAVTWNSEAWASFAADTLEGLKP
jgi:hypothetical protein